MPRGVLVRGTLSHFGSRCSAR